MSTSFNELDPATDDAFPTITDFDPDASLPPDPDGAEEDLDEDDPVVAGTQVDDSDEDDELLLDADAPEPETITAIAIDGPLDQGQGEKPGGVA